MTRTQEKLTVGAVAALLVVAAGYGAWTWRPANNENYPDGTFWICKNAACQNEFVMTVKELAEYQAKHYGEPIKCPKCGKAETVGAARCPSCRKLVSREQRAATCPHCKAPMTPS